MTTTTNSLRVRTQVLPASTPAPAATPAKVEVEAPDQFARVGRPAPEKVTPKKRVVIVGGGFAGLEAAKGLKGAENLEVVLIDPRGRGFEFRPLLIHLATGKLSEGDVATPQ